MSFKQGQTQTGFLLCNEIVLSLQTLQTTTPPRRTYLPPPLANRNPGRAEQARPPAGESLHSVGQGPQDPPAEAGIKRPKERKGNEEEHLGVPLTQGSGICCWLISCLCSEHKWIPPPPTPGGLSAPGCSPGPFPTPAVTTIAAGTWFQVSWPAGIPPPPS